ncbi:MULTISPECIES: type VI secretion system tube protein TssD [Flavobacterium]|uniref:Type VI secretion system tube protein TssD n=1 Tax=Flavobacterium covae TaxID=2906076 RepID=A0ABW8PMI9_9FLAO|nr:MULTISPECIES: type VI secretion system tube protein TssD [Flavobacterium]AMA48475.1 hypothetical protein AWN65_02880 [Flavobacterium covae]AND63789.1 hypothetical protein AX766_04835 [Flavobacterium covae]AND65397.1 hypothetical protein AX766_13885 [Flavobacterium covae]POR17480.1 hypothetical protein BWK57_14140 [Flavobacterium columnare]
MSFLAKLELDGNTYNILSFDYNFTQQIDATGKPEGMPQGGEINIRIESNGKSNLLQWMLDHSQTKNGTITFFRRDAMSKLQELKFEKAYCVSFSEYFDAKNNEPLQIALRLMAKRFVLNEATHEKKWKD